MSAELGHLSGDVPREFIGMARVFRQTVHVENEKMCSFLLNTMQPIIERLERKPSLRPEHLSLIRQAWDSMPQQFRLSSEFTGNHKHFRFNEARVFAAQWEKAGDELWNSSEPGIMLQLNVLDWRSGNLESFILPRALIGLHALGRWFERTGSSDTDSLLQDLRPLIGAEHNVKRVPCERGTWIGEPVSIERDNVVRIKTFVAL
jgi:hypothetical protein